MAGSAFAVAVVCMTAAPQVVVRLVTAAAEQVLLAAILFVALAAELAAAACRVVELEHWAAALGQAVAALPWREWWVLVRWIAAPFAATLLHETGVE